jgi:hypothetical protein
MVRFSSFFSARGAGIIPVASNGVFLSLARTERREAGGETIGINTYIEM